MTREKLLKAAYRNRRHNKKLDGYENKAHQAGEWRKVTEQNAQSHASYQGYYGWENATKIEVLDMLNVFSQKPQGVSKVVASAKENTFCIKRPV